jgi:hypothetical protein
MNEAQRRNEFLALVRNRMVPALRGADYDLHFSAVRAERPDLLDNRAAPTLALANNFDPSQPRDESGRWTDTGDGGMAWTTAKGTKVKVEPGGTVDIKGTRFQMKDPGPSALGKDRAEKLRRSGMNPDDYMDIGGGMLAHKDDADRWAEAVRRRKAFIEKVKASKPTPQEEWNNLVLERRSVAERGSGQMDVYKVERKMDEFRKAHPEYAHR